MKQFRELFRKRWFIAFLTALITVVSILDPFTATSVYAAGDWIELSYHCLSEEDVGSDAVAEISEEEDDDGMSVHLQEVELVDGDELMAGQSYVMVLTFKVDGVPTDSNAQQVQTASDSDADEDDVCTASDSDADEDEDWETASDSDADEDDVDLASDSDAKDSDDGKVDIDKIRYGLETYGIELEDVEIQSIKSTNGRREISVTVAYEISEETEPGTYYGLATLSLDSDDETYEDTQTFEMTVVSITPRTGGDGTTKFYLWGGIMILSAAFLALKKKKNVFAAALCAICFMTAFSEQTLAAGLDTDKDVTLTLHYQNDEQPISEAEFNLYYIATMSKDVTFTLTGDFKDYPVNLNKLDNSGWQSVALTLDGYIQRDNIAPLMSGVTNSNGTVVFKSTTGAMKAGLYMITGEAIVQDGYVHTPDPFVVWVPGADETTGEWNYDVVVFAKHSTTVKEPDPISRKVLKVWKDSGHTSKRPTEVEVELLKDGTVVETVKLNEENNWHYSWEGLDPDHEWVIIEKDVPAKYTVNVTRSGITYVITNTYSSSGGSDGPGDTPDKPSSDTPTETVPTDEITDDETPLGDLEIDEVEEPEVPLAGLPATGTLWWLVPILAGIGILLFLTGLYRSKRNSRNEE